MKADSSDVEESNYWIVDSVSDLKSSDYYALLDSLKRGKEVDFMKLRMAYTRTEDYYPYDDFDEVIDEINVKLDSSLFEEAIELAEKILKSKFVHLKAHMICCLIYSHLEDSVKGKYHYDIYDNLIGSILKTGDGKSKETAFVVISTSEEYGVLNHLGLKLQQQLLIHEDGHSFDRMKVADKISGEEYTLYFNVDFLLRKISEIYGK